MTNYPEWFLGGPWHGEDKRVRCPNLQQTIRVARPRDIDYRDLLNDSPEDTMVSFDEYEYVPQRANIFGELLTVWVGMDNLQESVNPNSTIYRELGKLIMSPHRNSTEALPAHMREVTEHYRSRWEIERQIRGEVDREHRRVVQDLKRRILELERLSVGRQDMPQQNTFASSTADPVFRDTSTPAGHVEIVTDEQEWFRARFVGLTLFFDEGNDEVKPSWVATAQGDDSVPYTGYGTSRKAAIIGLLADSLGVYARMVETEHERVR